MTTSSDREIGQIFAAAQQFAEAGRHSEAMAAYRACLARDARFLPACFALGQLLLLHGDMGAARDMLSRAMALARGDASALRIVAPALANLLSSMMPQTFDARLESDLLVCLDLSHIDAQSLSACIAQLLIVKYPGRQGSLDSIAQDPLWLAFLTRCMNIDARMESRLIALRRALMLHYGNGRDIPPSHRQLIWALAIQAFAGQYVWPVGNAEATMLARSSDASLFALYRPLAERDGGDRIDRRGFGALAVKLGRDDIVRERALAAAMPSIASSAADALDGSVSALVRNQYEESPYPRWRTPPAPRPTSLDTTIRALPGIDTAGLPSPPRALLIAGCGTGYEPIGLARTDSSLNITALDLSRASLAYGRLMADELTVSTVTFMQGDILAVADIGASFDIIFSTGVLHHMEHPEAGLAALCRVLKPGGVIKIALYSHYARGPIRAARALIAERGWRPTAEGIRAFRAHILTLPDNDALAPVRGSPDFYSMSGCRDLVFHVQEHQYTLPAIADMVRDAGLNMVALDPAPDILAEFRTVFGPEANQYDLALWDALEQQRPTLFMGMYHLWCQKPG